MGQLMKTNKEYVAVRAKDLERLLDDAEFYLRLEQAGVDNWIGFDDARDGGYGYSEEMDYWEFCKLSLLDKCDIADIKVYDLLD